MARTTLESAAETGSGRLRLVLVVAMARNRVIGRDGAMPWSLRSDLKRFRALTLSKPMIMGRRTLDSIGCVLDERDTIVLTRQASLPFEGVHLAHTPEEALQTAERCAMARDADEIMVVGGAEIYAAFLSRADRIALTIVEAEPDGDTLFPAIEWDTWRILSEEFVPRGERDSAETRFRLLERI